MQRIGASLQALEAEVARLTQLFRNAGAVSVDPGVLLPADVMLDLYGEDIRARAYVTHDPVLGERMIRPDFTVPVVQMHMEHGAEPARYTYAGPVWRKQVPGSARPSEYVQVGFELFDGTNVAKADAEVFALVSTALDGLDLTIATGDLGIVLAAISGLRTTARRRAALRRHLWRPLRFKRLLERYSGRLPARAAWPEGGPLIGLRSAAEIESRLAILREDALSAPLAGEEVALLEQVLAVQGVASDALAELRGLGQAALTPALDRMETRLEALAARGIGELGFAASYGRAALEYYDGFVFGFSARDRPDLPQIAQGGRYDALTKVLGHGTGIPAVGAVVRPEALLALREGAL